LYKKKIKVCIVVTSLAKGGAERSTAMLSKMLNNVDYEVHIIILTNAIDYDFSGILFNLGKYKEKSNSFFSKVKRFKAFREYLLRYNFDYIIDNRNRQFAFKEVIYLYCIYRNFKIWYVVRSFKLNQYFPENKWVSKKMLQKSDKIIGVSRLIKETVNKKFNTTKATHIYNPIIPFSVSGSRNPFTVKYIVFLGRLVENVKNFSLLLKSYSQSLLIREKVYLKILGEGPDKSFINNKIEEYHLTEYVDILPFTPKIAPFLKHAEFLVLTSHYEGFPRVLIEALSIGTPVVSVDCQSGPSEIIINEENGLLVENHNPEKLSEAMNRMILDKKLHSKCKSYSKDSVKHLHPDNIKKQWINLMLV